MYKAKYNVNVEKDSEGNEKIVSTLKATFKFRKEVAPKDREVVDKRTHYWKNNQLYNYLTEKEGLEYVDTMLRYSYFSDNSKSVGIRYLFPTILNCQGFKIKVTSNRNVPLEKMLNLDALNEFILTGEVKENN